MSALKDSFVNYKNAVLSLFNQFDTYRTSLTGRVGNVLRKTNNPSVASVSNHGLINERILVVEDVVDEAAAKASIVSSGGDAVYNFITKVIHVRSGSNWTPYQREYLNDHLPGGMFYYNPTTGRWYWAEVNGDLIHLQLSAG